MGKHIDATTKEQTVGMIKNDGITVTDAAAKFGVSTKAIYRWLRTGAGGTPTSLLAVNRLKQENRDLKELVGKLTLEHERAKKNRACP